MIMHDWRLTYAPEPNIDPRPWTMEIKTATELSFIMVATCPDSTERQVWIEIEDGRLVIHAYDPEHEEPINLRIGKTDITFDSDRDDRFLKHCDPKRHEAFDGFVRQMAGMSLPEEECRDAGYAEVGDYIADLDDERLCGEYDTFMDMVRNARELLK